MPPKEISRIWDHACLAWTSLTVKYRADKKSECFQISYQIHFSCNKQTYSYYQRLRKITNFRGKLSKIRSTRPCSCPSCWWPRRTSSRTNNQPLISLVDSVTRTLGARPSSHPSTGAHYCSSFKISSRWIKPSRWTNRPPWWPPFQLQESEKKGKMRPKTISTRSEILTFQKLQRLRNWCCSKNCQINTTASERHGHCIALSNECLI